MITVVTDRSDHGAAVVEHILLTSRQRCPCSLSAESRTSRALTTAVVHKLSVVVVTLDASFCHNSRLLLGFRTFTSFLYLPAVSVEHLVLAVLISVFFPPKASCFSIALKCLPWNGMLLFPFFRNFDIFGYLDFIVFHSGVLAPDVFLEHFLVPVVPVIILSPCQLQPLLFYRVNPRCSYGRPRCP